MEKEHALVQWVMEAQRSSYAADALIEQYIPFIKSETAKYIKRIPQEGQDDAFSIAMLAFYESIIAYKSGRGSFLRFAATSIKNRLIDHHRRERRHQGLISYHEQDAADELSLLERVADDSDHIQALTLREAAREEIAEFSGQLSAFDLSLMDIADNCPRQERTMRACMKVLRYARQQPQLLEQLIRSKKLPIGELAEKTGVDRKTLERHRKYLVAVLLAYTNGFEIIRDHLYQLQKKEVQQV